MLLNTKEKILYNALKLFNKKDTKSITTNHIAKVTKISPGNLYYYFKNKEEIINELYNQMTKKIDFENTPLPNNLCEFKKYCNYVANIWWEYIFLRKELLFLMSRDKELENKVIKDNKKQFNKLLNLIDHLIDINCLKNINNREFLAQTIMIYSQFWTPYLYIMGKERNKKNAKDISNQIEKLFFPYLTEKSKNNLKNCKGE